MDYKFTPKWILSAEIEFEAGGTGSAMELENSENGEAVLRLLKPFHSHLPVLPYNRHFPKEIPGAYHHRNRPAENLDA